MRSRTDKFLGDIAFMTNAINAYLEQKILSADPIETVRLLYQAAIIRTGDARRCLAAGNVPERTRHVNQVFDILNELTGSLDYEAGGDLSIELARLYDYMQRRLLEANSGQSDGPLAEVIALLSTVGEAWEILAKGGEPPPAKAREWSSAHGQIEIESNSPQRRFL